MNRLRMTTRSHSEIAVSDVGLLLLTQTPSELGEFTELLRDELDVRYCTSPEHAIKLRIAADEAD